MPDTTGTEDIAGAVSALRGQTAEYREQLARIRTRMQELEARREGATGQERIRLDYDLQMLAEMRRDLRAALRVCAANGERKIRRLSLDNQSTGAGLVAEYLAHQRRESEEETGEGAWMRQVIADGMIFFSRDTRDMMRLYYCGGMTLREVGEVYHLDRTSVSRRLRRARKRLQSYARDRARLRREVMGEEVDPEKLLRDLQCFDNAPRQRQVLTRFLEGQANFEIAADLHLRPAHVSRTRKRGAAKLEVLGDDADELRRKVRWGDRALLGSWKIEKYGPNHPRESMEKYDTTNPRAGGDEEGTA